MTAKSHRLDWVNNGEPFIVDQSTLRPSDYRGATEAELAAYIKATEDVDVQSTHPQRAGGIVRRADVLGAMAFNARLVRAALARVDKRVLDMTSDEVADRLTMQEYTAILGSINGKPEEKEAGASPLEQPRMSV